MKDVPLDELLGLGELGVVALDLPSDPPGGEDAVEAVVDVVVPVELAVDVAGSDGRWRELGQLVRADVPSALNRVIPDLHKLRLEHHVSAVVLCEVIAGLHFIA